MVSDAEAKALIDYKKVGVFYRSPEPISEIFPVPTHKHYRFRHRVGLFDKRFLQTVNFRHPFRADPEVSDAYPIYPLGKDRILKLGPFEAIWDRGNKGPPYKFGGVLIKSTAWIELVNPIRCYGDSGPNSNTYQGAFIPRFPGLEAFLEASDYDYKSVTRATASLIHDIDSDDIQSLEAYGPTAWNRYKPTKPLADFGQMLGEARDLTRLLHFRFKSLKDAGGNHLNVEFGWKPFISDLKKLLKMFDILVKAVAQLVRDNNRGVRRKGPVESQTWTEGPTLIKTGLYPEVLYPSAFEDPYKHGTEGSSSPRNLSEYFPYPTAFLPASHGGYADDWWKLDLYQSEEYSDTIRFSGRFRYYIEDVRDTDWWFRVQRELLGLTPNFSLIWELMPWSWLIDWFTNVGDVISNAEDRVVDKLTADYAYLVREKRRITTYTVRLIPSRTWFGEDGPRNPEDCTVRVYRNLTVRREASPYGFGLTIGDLSYRRMGILAALALQRSKL